MLVQHFFPGPKRPVHLVGSPAAVFTFSGPADSLGRVRLSGAFSRIHESFPGSYGNSEKTQGPGCTGCPFCIDSAIVADVTPNSIYSTKCARASRALRARASRARAPRLSGAFPRIHETFPGSYGNSNKTQGPGGASCPFRRFFRAP